MSEFTKIRDHYFKLKQHGTLAYIRDAKEYALDKFDFVLSVAYDHETKLDALKKYTIADNYGAGDLSRLEPCVFCEDFEKIESERDAMYEALKECVSQLIRYKSCLKGYAKESAHKGNRDNQAFWEERVKENVKLSEDIHKALAKAKGE